jgi:anti-anti-sigma factor
MTITQNQNPPPAAYGTGVEILGMPPELDLITADGLAERGYVAIAGHARLLLLDLTSLSFCDARGLGALVRIANHADATGCPYALIAPPRPVAKLLRITGLNARMPVFATLDDALAHLTALANAPAEASRGLAFTARRSAARAPASTWSRPGPVATRGRAAPAWARR